MPLADKKVLQSTAKNYSKFIFYKSIFKYIKKFINKIQSFHS